METFTRLFEMESCFLLEMGSKDFLSIRSESFTLPCGEVLTPGDCITEIHSSGSAGNLPITTSDGWVMRYIGKLTMHKEHFQNLRHWKDREVVLFDSFNENDNDEKFVAPGRRNKDKECKGSDDNFYMAYLIMSDNRLFHTRGGGTSCCVAGTGLTRWTPGNTN
ncbi:hypothetical protein F7U66_01305 [Vibrio parahaemolyticus]|nr:hypothetical protein [Vibrio parahaemolyticus]